MTDPTEETIRRLKADYEEESVAQADIIAALIIEGYIPKSKLPVLHNMIGDEKAGMVTEILEAE